MGLAMLRQSMSKLSTILFLLRKASKVIPEKEGVWETRTEMCGQFTRLYAAQWVRTAEWLSPGKIPLKTDSTSTYLKMP
jgi:hypothetical protein